MHQHLFNALSEMHFIAVESELLHIKDEVQAGNGAEVLAHYDISPTKSNVAKVKRAIKEDELKRIVNKVN